MEPAARGRLGGAAGSDCGEPPGTADLGMGDVARMPPIWQFRVLEMLSSSRVQASRLLAPARTWWGRAGMSAVTSRAVRTGRGALKRASKRNLSRGANMFGHGASVSVGGWASGLADDAYRSIGTGDTRWYTLLPVIGTVSAFIDTAVTCGGAIADAFDE